MKIKKVDDKPMVIHTKEKAKIHAHEPKGAKIKGSNIYTVERGPKTIGAKVSDDKKKSYRKSTIHQSEPKNKGLSRFKRNLKESNISIKTKNTNLHIAGRTSALAAGAVTEQVEGGQEVSQAAYLAYESSRPVTGTASKGAALFRKKAAAEAKKRIKKVEAGKKLAKKTAKKAAKDTAKTVAKETAKEIAKTTAKVATKTATKAAATAAGTAVAPGVGTAIGMAAGYAAGVSIHHVHHLFGLYYQLSSSVKITQNDKSEILADFSHVLEPADQCDSLANVADPKFITIMGSGLNHCFCSFVCCFLSL